VLIMDPDKNLEEQLEIAERLINEALTRIERDNLGEELAERVLAMNEWVGNGGFLPVAYQSLDERCKPTPA